VRPLHDGQGAVQVLRRLSAGEVLSEKSVAGQRKSALWQNVKATKTVDRLAAVLILLLGIVHTGLAPVFRGRYDGAGMWFLSGGLMLILRRDTPATNT
jgi:hypothetical protein